MFSRDSNGFYEVSLNNGDNPKSQEVAKAKAEVEIKVYKQRFWMLFLFSFLTLACGMPYLLYSGISDITSCYYGVSLDAVNWTCLIYMVVYIVLFFPVSWLMNKIGLRKIVIIGSLFNTLSCATQFLTLHPDNFLFVMLSEFLASLANVFVLAIPPFIAAVWFPSNEVSRACAFGVFGNQLGCALGFIISPMMTVADCSKKELILNGKWNVAIMYTALNVVIFLLIVFSFKEEPLHPPSIAQAEKKNQPEEPFLKSALSMLKNVHFVLIFIVYGLVVGVYFSIAALLNAYILHFFPGTEMDIGWMGALLIVTGLVGSIIVGYILDYTQKFKENCLGICILSLVTYCIFVTFIHVHSLWVQFVTIGILGFFLTSFLPVGFEYAIEVTYPESEIVSAGLLNASTMIFGIVLTAIATPVFEKSGFYTSNAVFITALLIACILSGFITTDYKRSKKNLESS